MKVQILQNFQSVLNIFLTAGPQLVKNSTSFRIISNEVTKLAELLEYSKYFFWLQTTCKKFYKLTNFEWSYMLSRSLLEVILELLQHLNNVWELIQSKCLLEVYKNIYILDRHSGPYTTSWKYLGAPCSPGVF